MTDAETLLLKAAHCRRMARRCTAETIARKFEALARDYEEHAASLRRNAIAGGTSLPGTAPRASVASHDSAPASGGS